MVTTTFYSIEVSQFLVTYALFDIKNDPEVKTTLIYFLFMCCCLLIYHFEESVRPATRLLDNYFQVLISTTNMVF